MVVIEELLSGRPTALIAPFSQVNGVHRCGRVLRPSCVASAGQSPHELHTASTPPVTEPPVMNRTETPEA